MPENTATTPRSTALARCKVLYLLAVTGTVFAVPALEATHPARWFVVSGLLGVQVATLLLLRVTAADILRAADRLKWLFIFLIACYVLLPAEAGHGHAVYTWHVPGIGLSIPFNLRGLEQSSLMCLQILTLIMVSAVVQLSGSGHDLVDGLRSFGLPQLFVYSIDMTLALLGGLHRRAAGGGGGKGGGGGRGSHRRADRPSSQPHDGAQRAAAARASSPGFFAVLGRLLRGDVGFFVGSIAGDLERARVRVASDNARSLDARLAHDAAVVTGVSLAMMSLKMLRFLPGIPFASGHKTLLLFPLYILASDLTSSRWGATAAGSIMGVLAYLQGDGRFGVFEILKHLAPGLVIDLLWPLVRRLPRSMWILCVLGFLAAIARTSTEFVTMLLLGSRLEVYAFPLAKLIPNVVAGTLSGCITYFVLPAFEQMRPEMGVSTPRGRAEEPPAEPPLHTPSASTSATTHDGPFADQEVSEAKSTTLESFVLPGGELQIDSHDTAATLSRRSRSADGGGGGGGQGGGHGGGHGGGGGRRQS